MEGFTDLMNMFAPKPGMDPFALGNTLATNPEAALPALAGAGPPPAQGQGFMDWVSQKISGAGGPPAQAPAIPRPGAPPPGGTALTGTATGQGTPLGTEPYLLNPLIEKAFPAKTGMDIAGDQPSPFAPGAPGTQPPPVPASLAAATAPPPTQGARPDIQTDMGPGGPQTPAPAASPKPPVNVAEQLKKAGSAFSGIKAPPAPTTQHISTPNLPRPQAMQTGGIEALIQAMLGRQALAGGGGAPLRLGNALYAGGRGLY
jgi:hypothetical protein